MTSSFVQNGAQVSCSHAFGSAEEPDVEHGIINILMIPLVVFKRRQKEERMNMCEKSLKSFQLEHPFWVTYPIVERFKDSPCIIKIYMISEQNFLTTLFIASLDSPQTFLLKQKQNLTNPSYPNQQYSHSERLLSGILISQFRDKP